MFTIWPPLRISGSSFWEEEHALEVDLILLIQLLLGHLCERGVVRDTGIVNEIVELVRPQSCQRRSHIAHEGLEARDVAGIELKRDGLGARRFGLRFNLVGFVRDSH
jgi:hypothetical protein